ncbi:MAG: hypothetical protein OEU36_02025 [Gammaproteobacteria bacterium]|nr:hypothetical protein [Gammaproteobacteria bacterium]
MKQLFTLDNIVPLGMLTLLSALALTDVFWVMGGPLLSAVS